MSPKSRKNYTLTLRLCILIFASSTSPCLSQSYATGEASRSRSFYANVMLAATGNLDNVELPGTDSAGNPIPYPGTPEWAALPEKTLSA